jgi:hypothetical protein
MPIIDKNIERNQALMDREAAAKAHTIQEDTDNNSTGNKEQQAPRRRSINTEKEKKSSPPPAPVTVSTPAVAIPVTTSQPQKNAEPVPETVSEKSPSTAISIAKGDELTAFEKEMKNLTIRLQQKGKLNPNMTWTNKDKSIGKNNSINMMLKHTIQGSLDPLSQWTASISGSFSGVTSISTKDCEHLFEKLQAKKYASPDNYNEPTKQH